jgi:hypothetical protein
MHRPHRRLAPQLHLKAWLPLRVIPLLALGLGLGFEGSRRLILSRGHCPNLSIAHRWCASQRHAPCASQQDAYQEGNRMEWLAITQAEAHE